LFCDTIQLNVFCTFGVIGDLQSETFGNVLDMLQNGICLENRLHSGDLLFATAGDLVILMQDDILVDKDSVLIVSGYGELRDFNLTLLQIDNDFEVEFHLLETGTTLS